MKSARFPCLLVAFATTFYCFGPAVCSAAAKAKPGKAKAAAGNPPVVVDVPAAGRYRFQAEVQLSGTGARCWSAC